MMKLQPIVAGGIGGLSPYMVIVAKACLVAGPTAQFSQIVSPLYYVGVILLALIGAVVCFLFQENNLGKAFVLGISAPALISATLSNSETSKNGFTWTLPNLITSGYAQNASTPPATPAASPVFGRYLNINLQSPISVNAEFIAGGGQVVLTAVLVNSTTQIPIPGFAQKVRFTVRDAATSDYPLPGKPGETATVTVTVKGQKSFGFQQAWGAAPDTTVAINVQPGSA